MSFFLNRSEFFYYGNIWNGKKLQMNIFCHFIFCHNKKKSVLIYRHISCDIAEIISCSLSHIFCSTRCCYCYCNFIAANHYLALVDCHFFGLASFRSLLLYLSFCALEWNEFLQLHCSSGPEFKLWILWALSEIKG